MLFCLCFPLGVFSLTFRSVVPFPFIFVYGVRKCSNLIVHDSVQVCSSFPRMSWLFRLFCVPILILKLFVLVLWKLSLVFWQRWYWICSLPWVVMSFWFFQPKNTVCLHMFSTLISKMVNFDRYNPLTKKGSLRASITFEFLKPKCLKTVAVGKWFSVGRWQYCPLSILDICRGIKLPQWLGSTICIGCWGY